MILRRSLLPRQQETSREEYQFVAARPKCSGIQLPYPSAHATKIPRPAVHFATFHYCPLPSGPLSAARLRALQGPISNLSPHDWSISFLKPPLLFSSFIAIWHYRQIFLPLQVSCLLRRRHPALLCFFSLLRISLDSTLCASTSTLSSSPTRVLASSAFLGA